MKTHIDRAAEIILRYAGVLGATRARQADAAYRAARALAEAGHLAPDLPEPDETGRRWKVDYKHLPVSHTSTSGNQVTLRTSYGWWHTDPAEAKSLAYALLAAADYAERNQ
ncbi:hypothetical protein [Corynebacterium kalidii]